MIKKGKKLAVLLIIALLVGIINISTTTEAAYTADKTMSTINPGDAIYFDKTGLDGWDNVQIYLWQGDTGTNYKSWYDADSMTKVEGKDNIYVFIAPEDLEADKYNMVIFKNGKDGNENQTIDLGFIEEGFVYKVDNWQDGKRIGYWYLYDNSSIVSHLENVKKYQEDKEYYTEASYGKLDELITKAATELEEIRLVAEKDENDNHTGKYYIQIDYTMEEIDDIVNNLVVDKEILKTAIDSEELNMDQYNETYTPNSVNVLKEKIEETNELYKKDTVTVEEIKQAINNIETAKNNLIEKADKTELEEILDSLSSLEKTDYTEESVEKVSETATNASEIYVDENATQKEVDDAVQALKDAINALEKKPVINEEEPNNPEGDNNQGDNNQGDNNQGDNNQGDDNQGDNNQGDNNQGDNNQGDNNQGDNTGDTEEPKNDDDTEKEENTDNAQNNTSSGGTTPKTGDNVMALALIFIVSVIGLTTTIVANKKRK